MIQIAALNEFQGHVIIHPTENIIGYLHSIIRAADSATIILRCRGLYDNDKYWEQGYTDYCMASFLTPKQLYDHVFGHTNKIMNSSLWRLAAHD